MAANNNTDAHKLLEKLQKQLEVGNVPLGAVGEKKYLGDVRVGSLKLAAKRQRAKKQQVEKEGNSASAVEEEKHSAEKTYGKIHIKGGRRRKTKRKRKHKRKHKKKTRSHKGGRKRKTKRRKTKRRKTKRRRRR